MRNKKFFFAFAGNTKAKAGDCMQSKKIVLLLGILALIATTGGLFWYWWVDETPKTPLRSRSVQIDCMRPNVAKLPLDVGMDYC